MLTHWYFDVALAVACVCALPYAAAAAFEMSRQAVNSVRSKHRAREIMVSSHDIDGHASGYAPV